MAKFTGILLVLQSMIIVMLYNFLAASAFVGGNDEGNINLTFLISSQIFGFLLTGFTLSYVFRVENITDYSKFEFKIAKVLLSIGFLISAFFLINLVEILQKALIPSYLVSSYLNSTHSLHASYQELARQLQDIHPAMLYLIGALLPAVCEEFFFRGYLLNLSMKYYSKPTSLFIVSLLFSLIHFQLIALIPLFIFGLILGILTIVTEKISYSILIHFLNNAITLYIVS
ncbi:MAG: CPBP family intramembrane glutamic endopeptidase [Candidatus Kapaibacterium sp.]